MDELNTPIRRETFNFKDNDVEIITLDELKRTYKENNVLGQPLREMYHYEIIDEMANILLDRGLEMQINEIFAAQNKARVPGVVINPEIEKIHGEKAIEAHVLRRVFANIGIKNFDNDELTTNAAMSFTQDNITLAYGPMVRICHNQCILSPKRVFQTSRNMGVKDIIAEFGKAMMEIEVAIEQDKEMIHRMKEYTLDANQILQTIGIFETMAVGHNTSNKEIYMSEIYPLNQTQVNRFTEAMLLKQKKSNEINLWDVYNVCTEMYKADNMDMVKIFPQHIALNKFVDNTLGIIR